MKNVVLIALFALAACAPEAENSETSSAATTMDIVGEPVSYSANGLTMNGYIAYDRSLDGSRPGILVVHEWWGHNEYARERAEMLAELGYTALAVDMFGEGKQADHPDTAGQFAGEVMQDASVANTRFAAALETLKGHPTVNPDHIGAIGYCFGGSIVLHAAETDMDLDAVASFHGGLGPLVAEAPETIDTRIQVHTGAADAFVPAESVEAFRTRMEGADADFEIFAYEGAVHSFTNPRADSLAARFEMPIAYDAEADSASWDRMKMMFGEVFE